MGSAVVPGRSLLESKCKLPHMEHLINPVNIYGAAPQGHKQGMGRLLILIVSQLIRLTLFLVIPALLMKLTLPNDPH